MKRDTEHVFNTKQNDCLLNRSCTTIKKNASTHAVRLPFSGHKYCLYNIHDVSLRFQCAHCNYVCSRLGATKLSYKVKSVNACYQVCSISANTYPLDWTLMIITHSVDGYYICMVMDNIHNWTLLEL